MTAAPIAHAGLVATRLAGRWRGALIEGPAGSATDESAGRVLAGEGGLHDARADRAILQRSGVVIELDQNGKARLDLADKGADRLDAVTIDIAGHAAGLDAVAHQAVAEDFLRGTQHLLAQHGAMGQHQRKGSIVADRAEISEMIGETLQLRHQRADIGRAWWNFQSERGFRRSCESQPVRDRAVARGARRELRR